MCLLKHDSSPSTHATLFREARKVLWPRSGAGDVSPRRSDRLLTAPAVQAESVGGVLLHAAGHAVAGCKRVRGGARARPVRSGRGGGPAGVLRPAAAQERGRLGRCSSRRRCEPLSAHAQMSTLCSLSQPWQMSPRDGGLGSRVCIACRRGWSCALDDSKYQLSHLKGALGECRKPFTLFPGPY